MALLEDQIVPETEDSLEDTIYPLLEASDFPVTSWRTGSVPRRIISALLPTLADAWFSVAQIANGVVQGLSKGPWLTLLGRSQYREERLGVTFTFGNATITDHGGGPHTVQLGSVVATDTGLRYVVVGLPDGDALAKNGALALELKAEAAASKYNVPNGAITQVVTSFPTCTVDNPQVGTTGTWITSLGTDIEGDPPFDDRLTAKWSTLATGSPPSAYLYWALSTAGVTRAFVDVENPDGPGTVRVYVDNASSVAALQATLEVKQPGGQRATAFAATTVAVALPLIITVRRIHRALVESDALLSLTEYQGAVDIGGLIVQAEITERVMASGPEDAVIDVAFTGGWLGAPNLQLVPGQIPQFTLSLTWIEV